MSTCCYNGGGCLKVVRIRDLLTSVREMVGGDYLNSIVVGPTTGSGLIYQPMRRSATQVSSNSLDTPRCSNWSTCHHTYHYTALIC